MNLEELQTARDRERQTDKLQQLRESFYSDAGEFIQQLRAERDRAAERAEDPFDAPEVNRLTDEINTAEQTVEAIYEKRVGKIVKAASFAAADLPAEADGMTAEEQELFETLVGDIKENRQRVLAVLAGEETGQSAPTEPTDTGVSAADLMGGSDDQPRDQPAGESVPAEPEPPAEQPSVPPASESGDGPHPESTAEATGPDPERKPGTDRNPEGTDRSPGATDRNSGASDQREPETAPPDAATHQGEAVRNDGGVRAQPAVERRTVRVTDDIETFVGSDERDYDLQPEDVVRLPEPNATLLIERDAAEQL